MVWLVQLLTTVVLLAGDRHLFEGKKGKKIYEQLTTGVGGPNIYLTRLEEWAWWKTDYLWPITTWDAFVFFPHVQHFIFRVVKSNFKF